MPPYHNTERGIGTVQHLFQTPSGCVSVASFFFLLGCISFFVQCSPYIIRIFGYIYIFKLHDLFSFRFWPCSMCHTYPYTVYTKHFCWRTFRSLYQAMDNIDHTDNSPIVVVVVVFNQRLVSPLLLSSSVTSASRD